LELFTPEDLKHAEDNEQLNVDANIFDLRPDPNHFVKFLKSLDRGDISSELFVRILEAYRESKTERDSDPMQ
jgi:hypothetical protein